MKILYHMVICPFSRQIRLMLQEKKVEVHLIEEKAWQLSERLLGLNPSGVLPVLEDSVDAETSLVVGDYAISEYLDARYPQAPLMGEALCDKNEIRRLCHWFNAKFYENVTVNLVFEKILKRQAGHGGPDSSALRRGRTALQEHLGYIDWLCDQRNWLAGSFFSMADIVAATHLSSIDYLGDVPWEKHPVAKEWYARIKSRPTFRPFLMEVVPGITPAPDYRNLDF
ncbi:MAG: glutathione S-transferase family protein [Alphaproteobacteria bacterium]